ncbi:hypothetical protein BD769DRAFT_1674586 [Suillus cothurnatus]|nr:hypothetical protein BD769DRAFT_1674586 [Suillus cothurnatus]
MQGYLQPPISPLASVSSNSGLLLAPVANIPASLPAATPARWSAASLPPRNPPGPPISGTTNDRRLLHHGHGHRFQHPTSQNSRSASMTQRRRGATKYLVVPHPERMHGTVHTEYEHMFREIHAPIPQKITSFISQARNFGLVFEIEDGFQKGDPAGPAFHQSLCSHFERVGLAFSGSNSHSPPSSSSLSTPMAQSPWSFLLTGKGQRSTRGAKLLPARSSPEYLTHNDIQKNGSRLPVPSAPYHDHTLVFILPLWDIIAGPIDGHDMHCCLAPRFRNGHFESSLHEEFEEIQCSTLCITQPVQDDVAAAIQTCQLSLLDALANSEISSTPTAPASTSQLQRPSVTLSGPSRSGSTSSVSLTSPASSSSESSLSLFAPTLHAVSVLPSPALSSPLFAPVPPLTSETTPRSPHVALRQWRNRPEHDLQLRRAVTGQEDHVIRITAPNAQKAPESFLALCKVWFLEGNDSQLVFPDDTEITNATPLNLTIGSIDATIGYGLMPEGYYMPTVTSLPPCDEDIISFRADSLIIRTGFILAMELHCSRVCIPMCHSWRYEILTTQTNNPSVALNTDFLSPPILATVLSQPNSSIHHSRQGRTTLLPAFSLRQGLATLPPASSLGKGVPLLPPTSSLGKGVPPLPPIFSLTRTNPFLLHSSAKEYHNRFLVPCYNHPESLAVFASAQPILQEMFTGRILTSPEQVIDILCPEPIALYSLPLRQGCNPNMDYLALAGQSTVQYGAFEALLAWSRNPSYS